MERRIKQQVQGSPAIDGAGVHLVRVLGHHTVEEYDPFLMLDSFDSRRPEDYTAGFPLHPHRGIETISFLSSGSMTHRDSLGNEDTVSDGEVQWMTAGSGIMHEEKLPAGPRMLGLQLWLNMPAKDKMAKPNYHAIKREDVQEIPIEGGKLRLLAGEYEGREGYRGHYQPLDYYDILLDAGASITLDVPIDNSAFVFTLLGDAVVAGTSVREKTAVLTTPGDTLTLSAGNAPVELVFASSRRLDEPAYWRGPIVMSTQEDLNQAFKDLREGTFLKEEVAY